MAISFYLDKRPNKQGEAQIRVGISIFGAKYITTIGGLRISPNKWDARRQRVKQGAINAEGVKYSSINARLADITDKYTAFENECVAKNIRPTDKDLKDVYEFNNGRRGRKSNEVKPTDRNIMFYINEFIRENSALKQWAEDTPRHYKRLGKILMDYNRNVTFDDIDEQFLNGFFIYLMKQGRANVYIKRILGFLTAVLNWARLRGYTDKTDYQKFNPRIKTTKKKVIFLDWDELMRVYNCDIPADGETVLLTDWDGVQYKKRIMKRDKMELARDILCFCSFTSLRFSDVTNLKHSHIEGGKITITTKKTADTLTIELNKYALSILERYVGYKDPLRFVFPSIDKHSINEYIKDVCELCGINKPITQTIYRGGIRVEVTKPKYELISSHAGRRTFVCNALMLGIPPQIIMKWTGHSSYNSMKPYIDVSSATKEAAMDKFNKL